MYHFLAGVIRSLNRNDTNAIQRGATTGFDLRWLETKHYLGVEFVVKIVYGSLNSGKLAEVLQCAWSDCVEFMPLSDVCRNPIRIVEGGSNYEMNAAAKAQGYAKVTGMPCIADDAGLELTALGGLPGVYTGRFGLARLVSMLKPEVRYSADFVCCASYAESNGRSVSLQARIRGAFLTETKTEPNDTHLPFSAHFIPCGEVQSLRSLIAQGNYRSHRVLAIEALLKCLEVCPK